MIHVWVCEVMMSWLPWHQRCVHAVFADTQENPELIWNDESREKVCDKVKQLADRSVLLSAGLTPLPHPCPTPCPTSFPPSFPLLAIPCPIPGVRCVCVGGPRDNESSTTEQTCLHRDARLCRDHSGLGELHQGEGAPTATA